MQKSTWKYIAGLVLIAAVFYGVNLGARPFDDYDEADYATIARETSESGDFLTMTRLGKPFFEKPPLQIWLMIASSKIFGLTEFALRLPSALFGILSVLFVFLILKELTGNNTVSFSGGIILIAMPFFLAAARHVRLDVPVSAAILAALYFYIKGLKDKKYLLGVGVSIAAGVLLKSVIGFFAFPILIIWSIFNKQWGWIRSRYFWLGIILMAALLAPWHIYEAAKFGNVFWNDYLGYHIFQRATQNILNNTVSLGYFMWVLWVYSQPWSTLTLAGTLFTAAILFRNKLREALHDIFPAIIGALLSATFIFSVFAFSKTRLLTYFTPMYPFIAIFLTLLFFGIMRNVRKKWKPAVKSVWATIIVIGLIVSGHEAFVRQKIYALDISYDEKEIGLYLALNHHDEDINVFQWGHHNTLRYYSGRNLQPLQIGDETVEVNPPFWLILPTGLLEQNQFLRDMPMPYSGEFLTLVHFQP